MNKLMKRLLVVAVFVLAIVGMTVLCASAADTTGYENDEAAIAADSTFVLRVGEEGTSATYYTTLNSAFSAAPSGSTIYVIQDFTSAIENSAGNNMTFTVMGVDKGDGTYPTVTVTANPLFNVRSGANVTVSQLNVNFTGGYMAYLTGSLTLQDTVTVTGTTTSDLFGGTTTGELVIDGATIDFIGGGDGIEIRGFAYITGGASITFKKADGAAKLALYNNAGTVVIDNATISGTYYQGGAAKTYIVGENASFPSASASSVYMDDAGAAANGRVSRLGTAATEISLLDGALVANVRPVSAYYTTLNAAATAVTAESNTIVLIADYTQTGGAMSKPAVPFTLTSVNGAVLTVNTAWLLDLGTSGTNSPTIRDIEIVIPKGYNLGYFNKASLTIDSGAYIHGEGSSATQGLIYSHAAATVITVNAGAKIEVTGGTYPMFGMPNGGTLNITGGELIHRSSGYMCSIIAGTMNISGGTMINYGTNAMVYYKSKSKVTVSGSATMIHEGPEQDDIFLRDDSALIIDGADVKLIARGNNFIFENGYQTSISGFNDTTKLIVRNAYLSTGRADGIIIRDDVSAGYVDFTNITLDSDAAAAMLHGDEDLLGETLVYYFNMRIDTGSSAREITIPATLNNEAVTKTVYSGYYKYTYAQAIAACPTDGTASTIYFLRDMTLTRVGSTKLATGQNITFNGNGHNININGSNATWFLEAAAGSSLTLANINFTGCPTQFLYTRGAFAMIDGATMTLTANSSTSETTPIFSLVEGATFTMAEGTTIETVYPDGERIEGEPDFKKNPHMINMESSFTGTVDVAGTITHNWDATKDWGPIFRIRGNATIIIRSSAIVTLNTTAAAAGGQAMFLEGDGGKATVTVEAGAQLASTTYPLFFGDNISFDSVASAVNAGFVARIGDTLLTTDYYDTLLGAVKAVASNGTVYVLQDYTVTKALDVTKVVTIRSLSDAEDERVTLTLGANYIIDTSGNSASTSFTFDYININAKTYCLSYLYSETLIIGANAYVYGAGNSNGLLYANKNGAEIIVNGEINVTSSNAAIKLENNCTAVVNGTITRTASGNVFYLTGSASLTINGGEYSSQGSNMFYLNGTGVKVTINGGEFKYTAANTAEFIRIEKISALTLNGGTFTRAGGTGDSGGFFYYVDASDNGVLTITKPIDANCSVYLHSAVQLADISTALHLGFVAHIGDTMMSNTFYKSLATAVAAVPSNGGDVTAAETTIRVLCDVTQTAALTVGSKNVVFESEGETPFTVTVTLAGNLFDYQNGSLRFKNIIFDKDAGAMFWVSTGSKLIVDEGAVLQGALASGSLIQLANANTSLEVKRGGTVRIEAGATGSGSVKLIDATGNGKDTTAGTITIAGTVEHAGTATGQALVFLMPTSKATLYINNGARIILSAATTSWSALFRVDSTIVADATPAVGEEAYGILLKTTAATHWGIRSPNTNNYPDTFIGVTFDLHTPKQIANDAGCFDLLTLQNVSFATEEMAYAAMSHTANKAVTMLRVGAVKNTMENYTEAYTGYYSSLAGALAAIADEGTIYVIGDMTLPRVNGTTIAAGQDVTLDGNGHTVTINGSNGTWFLTGEAGSALTLTNITVNGCPTKFITTSGDFAMTNGATMTLEANGSTSETTPIIDLVGAATFTMAEGTTIETVYPDGERIEGEPDYGKKNPHMINMDTSFTGTIDVAGTITHNWDATKDWGPIFRIRGNATIIIRSSAIVTLNTTAAAAGGQAMFLEGDGGKATVTIEAGAQLASTTYPLFNGDINFNSLQDALNLGMKVRLGDTLKASSYYKTLNAALGAVTANNNVVCLIDNFTQDVESTDPAASFTLTSVDKDGITLTVGFAWLFDYGNNTKKTATFTNITINLQGNNLGYFRDPVVIGAGTHIYGTGKSGSNGMIAGINEYAVFTVEPGAVIDNTHATNPIFGMVGGKLTINGGTFNGGSLIYGTSAITIVIKDCDYNFTSGTGAGIRTTSSSSSLTINGGTFDTTNASADNTIRADGPMTITGGTFTVTATYNNPIRLNSGTSSISGATFKYSSTTNGFFYIVGTANVTFESGTFTTTGGSMLLTGVESEKSPTVTVSGGEWEINRSGSANLFTHSAGTLNVSGGIFTITATTNNPFRIAATANFTGGTINNSTALQTIYITTGGTLTVSDLTVNGPFLNQDGTAVVTVNSGTYTNKADASTFFMNGASTVLTIAGGSFSHENTSATNMIQVQGGTLNISGGTFIYYGTGDGTANNTATDNGSLVRYKTTSTKIHMTGGMMIHEGAGTGFIFMRQEGALIIEGENVALIARGQNYVFEQAYQNSITDFNDTSNLIVRNGAYLSSERAELVLSDPTYYSFSNVTLDGDAAASTLKGGSTLYFMARLDDVTKEITIPATKNNDEVVKTVYTGYYTSFMTVFGMIDDDSAIYVVNDTSLTRASITVNGNLTIHLNGHTITAAEANDVLFNVAENATLTLLNGTVKASNRFAYVYGTLNLGDDTEGEAFVAIDPEKITTCMFYVSGTGVMNVNKNATLRTTATASVGKENYITLQSSFSGAVNVYGTIELNHTTTGAYKMFRASSAAGGSVNVYDGAILTYGCNTTTASDENAIFYNYDCADFTYNIYGGTFTVSSSGAAGTFLYKGALNISGGTFNSTGSSSKNIYVYGSTAVSITGGEFTASAGNADTNVQLETSAAFTISDATFTHNGTGSCLSIKNGTNNVNITGNTTITHNGTTSTSNIALNRAGGKYIYVNGADANLTISAPNGAYLLRTAYNVTLSNLTLNGTTATMGCTTDNEDHYMVFTNVAIPSVEKGDAWQATSVVSYGDKHIAYTSLKDAFAYITTLDVTDVTISVTENTSLARYSDLPAGMNVTLDGLNNTITVNGSNATRLFSVPADSVFTLTNVTFSDCPVKFVENLDGTLNLTGTFHLIAYSSDATNDGTNRHECTPLFGLREGAVLNMAEGATITFTYVDGDETPDPIHQQADFHVFHLRAGFDGELNIAGSIVYNWNTNGISAIVYSESGAAGTVTVESTASLTHTGTSTNGTAQTNGFFVLYGATKVKVAEAVYEAMTPTDVYVICVGAEMQLQEGYYVTVVANNYTFKVTAGTTITYVDTIGEVMALITTAGVKYTVLVQKDYTYSASGDAFALSKAYTVLITGADGVTLTETSKGFLFYVKGGANVTVNNLNIVTNGAMARIDTGSTNSYLTFADGVKINASAMKGGNLIDIWGKGHLTLEQGSEIDTTGATATSAMQLILAQGSFNATINLAGKITHAASGNHNHKIVRLSTAGSNTGVVNVQGSAELIFSCPNTTSKEASILYNYPDSSYGDIYTPKVTFNVYEGAKLTHTTKGAIIYNSGYLTSVYNIYGGTLKVTGGASVFNSTHGGKVNVMGGTFNISDGDFFFGGDQTGTYTVSGDVTMNLASVTMFETSSKLYTEEVIFTDANLTVVIGAGVTAAASGADARYVKHNASLFESDEIAAIFLASFKASDAYYTELSDAISGAKMDPLTEERTVYVVRDGAIAKRVSGGISLAGKFVTIDGQGHTVGVNGANDQFLFVVPASGGLTLKNITLTDCPTKLISASGNVSLTNADIVLYTKIDNEAVVNETSPLVYLTGESGFSMDADSSIRFVYEDGDDQEKVDNQANIFVFHTASDWNGQLDVAGTVYMGWHVEGRSPIFYLEGNTGKITLAATAIIEHAGTAGAMDGKTLFFAPVGGTMLVKIAKAATLTTNGGAIRIGDVTPADAATAARLAYEAPDFYAATVEWGAMIFNYTAPTWSTENMRWEGYGFTPKTSGANLVTVTNTGTLPFDATLDFTPIAGLEALTYTFKNGEVDAASVTLENENDSVAIAFMPYGIIPENIGDIESIGSITISLTEGGNS